MRRRGSMLLAACLQVGVATAAIAAGDDPKLDTGRFAIAGYGDFSYTDPENENSYFGGKFVPIFLFQLSEKIHVETELEFSMGEGGETETEIEYANLHYFVTDSSTITAGKFLLPFGQFGPNVHPSWINKLPTNPGIYGGGGHGGSTSMQGLMPIMSDFGVGYQNTIRLGEHQRLFIDLYVVNGPGAEAGGDHDEAPVEEEHDEDPAEVGGEVEAVSPEIAFDGGGSDNNNNKAFGGRVALALLPGLEWGVSYYQGAYDNEGELDFEAGAFDLSLISRYISLRGEYIKTNKQILIEDHDVEGAFEKETETRDGWYLQGSWSARQLNIPKLNPVELVLRHSQVGGHDEAKRWTFGVNYWFDPRAVTKIAIEQTKPQDLETETKIKIQFAYGF
jgi:hypothetical protein